MQTLRLDVEPWPQPLRWALVSKGFELPATFCGDLRYEDPDGDLISMSTDDEVEEALRLCYDGQTLRMTIIAARDSPAAASPQDEAPVGKAWPKPEVLSNVFEDNEAAPPVSSLYSPSSPASVSSASGNFEMLEINSHPDSVDSSAAASQAAAGALKSAEEEGEALHLNSFKTHTLHLGRNIPIQPRPSQYWPGGYWGPPIHTDKVSHQMWMRFLQDTVRVLMPCCTIQDGIGIWKGEIEETKIISVTVDEGSLNAQDILNNIKAVGEEWKRQFHQEAVTLTTTPVSNFVLI